MGTSRIPKPWWGYTSRVIFLTLAVFAFRKYSIAANTFLQENPLTSESTEGPASVRRQLLEPIKLWSDTAHPSNGSTAPPSPPPAVDPASADRNCGRAFKHPGFSSSCDYVLNEASCSSGTYLEYLHFHFCACAGRPWLSYVALGLWLSALFFMLGNTAADFFCPSLKALAELLALPPTVAGVTLLPLGNGAPDVFASIASFVGAGQAQVGLNSVLGAALFVTSVVVGSVAIAVSRVEARQRGGLKGPLLDKPSFVRDLGFFLFALMGICGILLWGRVHLWGALLFFSIYVLYGASVAASEGLRALAAAGGGAGGDGERALAGQWRLLQPLANALPQWMWTQRVELFAETHGHHRHGASGGGSGALEEWEPDTPPRPLWGWEEEEEQSGWALALERCQHAVKLPLVLPRVLTIPIIEDDQWHRGAAITSAAFAPLLVALVLVGGNPFGEEWREWLAAAVVGVLLGVAAVANTVADHPPRHWALPWVAGGFVMSIVWFYLIANELVAVLVSFGVIFQVDSAILGLTVLAWGNSIGDFVSNVALASSGSAGGVQMAVSGCYAGPMFNTLVGLGASMVLAAWRTYPEPFLVPEDPSIFWTLGFLVVGIVVAGVAIPYNKMRPSWSLGFSLVALYAAFMTLRIGAVFGWISVPGLRPL